MAQVLLISGSPSKVSKTSKVLDYVADKLDQNGVSTDTISIRDLPPEDLVYAKFDSSTIKRTVELIEEADVVIVATPVYKASYTGLLKSYIDLLPQSVLSGKAVVPIALGGSLAHLLVIEYALKPVLSAVGAQTILNGVYGLDTQVSTNSDGSVSLGDDVRTRFDAMVQQVIQSLRVKVASL
ncbi:NADPH-dependent FMN reductase [Alicyclobacillus fastidiosus]|uniref:NADPH-dependent FMN reductase n=1 Tax=Alicyclobacillus fastidiosus TaxID=392011 RepID=A0ABY6ZCS2_9BACL|nr:NADPH-dependent FMN reductase [Alicyclobacillus fastidiosus]WAH39989.1 NADPH-dependent FMN reductase [Alicyclobacillus fastidiosus]GMA61280.1 FMN reductase (NADPH) [Alicyclobacillus fastidiosus]